MLERTQPFALALLVAGLTVLNAGCTSSRLLKSDGGFGWLGSKSETNLQRDVTAFPPPSSIEIPQAVNNQQASNQPGAVSQPNVSIPSSIATRPQMGRMQQPRAAANNTMVQNGLYDIPAAPAQQQFASNPPTGQPAPPQDLAPPAAPPITSAPPVATPYGAMPPTQNIASSPAQPTPPANQERSIYETETPIAKSPIDVVNHEEPVEPEQTIYHSESQIDPGIIYNGPPIASPKPLPIASPQPPTFYETQTQQPRPWRPGSTSDLKTL